MPKQITPLVITFQTTAEDGVEFQAEERYVRNGAEGTEARYQQCIKAKDGTWHPGSWAYSGYDTDEAFSAYVRGTMQDRAKSQHANRVAASERDAIVAEFDALLPNWLHAIENLSNAQELIAALRTACEWYDALPTLRTIVENERPQNIRTALRSALADAKRTVREDYPEEYRETDEKEDFYEDHADEIAEHLAGAL